MTSKIETAIKTLLSDADFEELEKQEFWSELQKNINKASLIELFEFLKECPSFGKKKSID